MSDVPLWVTLVAIGVPAGASIVAAVVAGRFASKARLAEGRAARLLALDERTAQRRLDVYEPFIATLGDLLTGQRKAQALGNLETVMLDFQNFVVLWGSDDVVTAFYRFRRASSVSPPAAITMRLAAELLIAMRRDLAWPDSTITSLEVFGARITDLKKGSEMEGTLTLPFDQLILREKWTPPW